MQHANWYPSQQLYWKPVPLAGRVSRALGHRSLCLSLTRLPARCGLGEDSHRILIIDSLAALIYPAFFTQEAEVNVHTMRLDPSAVVFHFQITEGISMKFGFRSGLLRQERHTGSV